MRQAETWRAELIDLRAQIEARLDFSDEDDVEPELPDRFRERIGQLLDQLQSALARGAAGEQIRQGFRVVLTGPPNSGKSSLLNALARRDVAIVTDEPGTTRDLVEVSLNLAGTLVRVVDTAGIRGAESEAEQIGIRRARDALQTADLVLRLETGRVGQAGEDFKRPCISLTTKADLVLDREAGHRYVSVRTGEGLDLLISDITAAARAGHSDEPVLLSRERHRTYVQQAHRALTRSCGACDEVAADLLRQASDAIGQLTGRVGVEQVLERLFNEFCIGK
jgi:tRNA modification GTPase